MAFGGTYIPPSAYKARRVVVGGVLVILDNQEFIKLAGELREAGAKVIHGFRRGLISRNKHLYIIAKDGVAYITESDSLLPISVDIEAKDLVVLWYY